MISKYIRIFISFKNFQIFKYSTLHSNIAIVYDILIVTFSNINFEIINFKKLKDSQAAECV